MVNFSHYPLQKSVFQKLSGDTTLTGLINGVFDRSLQEQNYPYVTLGESLISDWSTKTTNGTEQIIVLRVWSREGGRKQVEIIMERIHTLLHDPVMTVDGQTLISMRFSSSAINLESDGWTYHGVMRFKALLQAN